MLPDAKNFIILAPYQLKVLWFKAERSMTVIYESLSPTATDDYERIPRTNVIFNRACLDGLRQLFIDKSNRELIDSGALPPASNTVPAAIRKHLDIQRTAGRPKRAHLAEMDSAFQDYHQPHILVVDDDIENGRFVQRSLMHDNFTVNIVLSAEDCLQHIARSGFPDLALIDIHMPGMDGLTLSKKLLQFSDMPIIMFTADRSDQVVTQSITEFAEDYIVKPCSPTELKARIGRILSRVGRQTYRPARLMPIDQRLTIDIYGRRVFVKDRPVQTLSPRETKLLFILLRNSGHVVTHEVLKDRLWRDQPQRESLHVYIYRLRKKIEVDPHDPTYILSERGVGYRFQQTTT